MRINYSSPFINLAHSKTMRKAVNWAVKETPKLDKNGNQILDSAGQTKMIPNLKKLKKHLPPACAVWITGFYMYDTAKSKKIPEERKQTFIINHLLSVILGVSGGYALSNGVEQFCETLVDRVDKLGMSTEKAASFKKGLNSMVPLLVFTLTVRFLSPIIATPLADKVNTLWVKHKNLNASKEKA